MLTEKDYCDKDLSATLIKMGFRGFGFLFYDKDNSKLKATHQILTVRTAKALGHTLAISLYEAQKFLRDEKNIDVLIELETKDIHLSSKYYSIYISYMSRFRREFSYISQNFDSYEEALSEGVKCAVKILKQNETIHR